jgi:tetratricopeptide (TPR) repeat protein
MRRIAAAITFCACCAAAPCSIPAQAAEPPTRRMALLSEWLQSVQSHEPGDSDGALDTIASWPNSRIRALWLDVQALLQFVHCLGCNAVRVRGLDGKLAPIPFTKTEIAALQEMAATIREQRRDDEILKRGAILHADVVMIAKPQPALYVEQPRTSPFGSFRPPPGPEHLVLQSKDGRQERLIDDAAHWELAYALLDRLPAPQRDETVQVWYRATTAYLQSNAMHEPAHFERALRLFPADAEFQFQTGCLHETLASPRVQAVLRSATVPAGVVVAVKSEHGELEIAERYFRRAIALDPGFQEAHLRLGRVLGLLDRHEEAAAELRQVTDDVDHPALRYYTALFLGREEEVLGHLDAARAAYQRAGDMFPLAQSPQIALSHLARDGADRARALAHAERVLGLPPNEVDRRDPFWVYHFIEGRHLDDLLDQLYTPFRHRPHSRRAG